MTDLLIHCKKKDLAFPLERTLDLAMQGSLVGLDRQEEGCALLLELLNAPDPKRATTIAKNMTCAPVF